MVLYWTTTGLICVFLALSAGSYLLHQETINGVRHLGFPDFFRIQLAVMKLAAIPALALPSLPWVVANWAYAGVALFIVTAMVAHYANQDPIWLNLVNLVLVGVLVLSYVSAPK